MRRPRFITLVRLFALAAFLLYAIAGAYVLIGDDQELSIGFALIALAIVRLAAVIGLQRMRPWARRLEIAYNWTKVAAALALIVVTPDRGAELAFFVAIIVIIPLVVLRYLHRRNVRMLFAGEDVELPEPRVSWTMRLTLAAIVTLLIAAVMIIPNLDLAPHDGRKAMRTMADMRSIATAWEARATDFNRYNAAGAFSLPPAAHPEEITTHLVPTYIKSLPREDGWGHPYEFFCDGQHYAVRSLGRDGKPNRVAEGPTTNWDCDIVFAEGKFIAYPNGMMP